MASILANLPKTTPYRRTSSLSRSRRSMTCQCCLPTEPNKAPWAAVVKMYGDSVERLKNLRESLSPQVKGDWKDIMLVCFSFAVYMYMSQQLVSTVLVWLSKQPEFS